MKCIKVIFRICSIPDNQKKVKVEFYGPNFINTNDREDFIEWHNAQIGKSFIFGEASAAVFFLCRVAKRPHAVDSERYKRGQKVSVPF